MTDTPSGGLTPPGPPTGEEPVERRTGAMSVDEWLANPPAPPAGQPGGAVAVSFAPAPWRELDRTSLTSFLLALTWVGAPVAVVVGGFGLRRTADGGRAGRWAAVTGILLGLVGSLALVAGVAGTVWYRSHIKRVEQVEAGECVDIDDSEGILFDIRDCTEPHRGEVVATGELDSGQVHRLLVGTTPAEFCGPLLDEPYGRAARSGDFLVLVVVEHPDDLTSGDAFACYVERADGQVLSAPITSGGGVDA